MNLIVGMLQLLNKKYNSDVPLVLMNSFNTDEDTDMILRKYASCQIKIHTFNQNRYFLKVYIACVKFDSYRYRLNCLKTEFCHTLPIKIPSYQQRDSLTYRPAH